MRAFRGLVVSLLALMSGSVLADAGGQASSWLTHYQKPNQETESYYAAGDPYLVEGFRLLDKYWTGIAASPHLARGHLDSYLPIELKQLKHKPAERLMHHLARAFFDAQNPTTGLIPFSYNAWSQMALVRLGGKQPGTLIARAQELHEWFPEDDSFRERVRRLAHATQRSFDFQYEAGRPGGMWAWADVESGAPQGPVTVALDFGQVSVAMARLSKAWNEPALLDWADQKLQFAWDNRLPHQGKRDLPVLADQFIPSAAVYVDNGASDTDTLYLVRQLYTLHSITHHPNYKEWALSVTDIWLKAAWKPNWGHFVRKIHPDGTSADLRMYGDGKYNTLAVLLDAYEATKQTRYLDSYWLAWHELQRMSGGGLIMEAFSSGAAIKEQGLDKQQTVFLELLTRAAQLSGRPEHWREVTQFGDLVIKSGEEVMRAEGGQSGTAFLKLGLSRQPVARLTLDLAAAGTTMTIHKGDAEILRQKVPGRWAVVYLPVGRYSVTLERNQEKPRRKVITVSGNMDLAP